MLIQISQLIGLPIVSSEDGAKIAVLKNPLIDPQGGQLIAWEVRTPNFFQNLKIISNNDIIEYNKKGIVAPSRESLVEASEIIRAQKILSEKIRILGAIARTESGKIIGKIYDLSLNTELEKIVKLYIKGIFRDRIVPSDAIIKVDRGGVILEDDIAEAPARAFA